MIIILLLLLLYVIWDWHHEEVKIKNNLKKWDGNFWTGDDKK